MHRSSEENYILKRKIKAKILSGLFIVMRVFPVNKKKVAVSTFEGDGGFCCNPRYIVEELHRQNDKYKIVWLTKKESSEFPTYVHVKKYTPWRIAYHLATSKVWIDNYRKPLGTLKRKGQLYIQTWHASIGFKAVGLYRGDLFPKIARLVSEWDSKLTDYVISNSEYCDRVYPKKLLYNGPTLRYGSPRVDCLINDRDRLRYSIREKYGIAQSDKLLMFAPTFRGGNQKGNKQVKAPIPTIDFDALIDALEKKYDSSWKVFLRLHPQLSAQMDKMPLNKNDVRLIDVSQEPDINELMAACDMVITDYSSCAFDAAFAHIPVLLYADDVEEYIKNRGQFVWEKEELPFDFAGDNEKLIYNIGQFDFDKYSHKVDAFVKQHSVVEKGDSAERVVRFILDTEKAN